MDAVSYSLASKQAQRIEKFIENPDSTSGILTQPSVIQTGETVTVPIGRTAILANTQIDGTLTVDGTVFIPSGATLDGVVEKVVSTDNAVVRFNGTTGEVQNSSVTIDDNGIMLINNAPLVFNDGFGIVWGNGTSIGGNAGVGTIAFNINGAEKAKIDVNGNLLLTSGTGALGYGTGAGGTVTQLTSKGTAVTLNKPCGRIIMNNSSLAAGAVVGFAFNNNLLSANDKIEVEAVFGGVTYNAYVYYSTTGTAYIAVENKSGTARTDVIDIKFFILKGAAS